MHPLRNLFIKALPWITGLCVLAQLLSLKLGLLNAFFFDAVHADVQGIDYFSLPKAFLNLAAGRSAYATFDPPAYGPHYTWFILHPAVAVWLGSWLSLFDPMTAPRPERPAARPLSFMMHARRFIRSPTGPMQEMIAFLPYSALSRSSV